MRNNTYRNGKVHICAKMCKTCIFRPGNIMQLEDGRVDQMVQDSIKNDSAIICHSILEGDNAVCRGFFDRHETAPLQIAQRLGFVEYLTP